MFPLVLVPLAVVVVGWLLLRRAASSSVPLPSTRAPDAAPLPLSARREAALAAVAAVVPSKYPDEKFAKLAPGWHVEPDGSITVNGKTVPTGMTTCGYLPGYVGATLGLEKNLNSYGLEAMRTNAKAWNAWVVPAEGRLPQPGDPYAISSTADGTGIIVHVGVFVRQNADGSWHTADAGQGTHEVQAAAYMDRPYDPVKHTLGGPKGPRPLAGWVNLDQVPVKSKIA